MIVAGVICITIRGNGSTPQTWNKVRGFIQEAGRVLSALWYEKLINNPARMVTIQTLSNHTKKILFDFENC